jgi:hypothetical protein
MDYRRYKTISKGRRKTMIEQADRGAVDDPHTPLWRRVTALFSLGSLVVVLGVLLAAVIGAAVLLMLFVLDRAIAG